MMHPTHFNIGCWLVLLVQGDLVLDWFYVTHFNTGCWSVLLVHCDLVLVWLHLSDPSHLAFFLKKKEEIYQFHNMQKQLKMIPCYSSVILINSYIIMHFYSYYYIMSLIDPKCMFNHDILGNQIYIRFNDLNWVL